MKEFDLISRYFSQQTAKRKDVVLGIGDDCALLAPAENQHIAVTTDTLVAGVHFPENTSPRAIGHKAVAVNLSDLAAVGAEPTWISLALTLPNVDQEWISEFSIGVFELCEYYNVQLVGGDTTQGPLSITITAQGIVPKSKFIRRSTAKAGDWLYVTGELGDAALALQNVQGKVGLAESVKGQVFEQLDYPKPRVLAGQALRDYATSAIDISDGLLADLAHICKASEVGAKVILENVPISAAMLETLGREKAIELAVSGGDDYELLFSVSEDNKVGMETALSNLGIPHTCIGQLNRQETITTVLDGEKVILNGQGFEHFAESVE
ncbi:thiamine-phosphate kinase [Pseudocolwellia sp. HL-MZ19]|uniref:thiamine-phosphate kinase n=1 Tax=Pseudocolwellia sp. HL-MZ19 TaxID=3400846 RepID=UPI003CF59E6C